VNLINRRSKGEGGREGEEGERRERRELSDFPMAMFTPIIGFTGEMSRQIRR
jgi:hypothetical protein